MYPQQRSRGKILHADICAPFQLLYTLTTLPKERAAMYNENWEEFRYLSMHP